MVQTVSNETSLTFPWHACVQGYFRRYPNPQACHVLYVDVLERRIEERTYTVPGEAVGVRPVLCTSRLILKKGSLPSWAPKNIVQNSTSWVLEESEVDLTAHDPARPRVMSVWTRNLDHTSVLAVTEGLKFSEENAKTQLDLVADVRSDISFGLLRRRIEKFGKKRYLSHMDSSRHGLEWAILRMAPDLASAHTQTLHLGGAQVSRRQRLMDALRPPFLDGYPLSPWQWAKKKWRQLRDKFRRTPDIAT